MYIRQVKGKFWAAHFAGGAHGKHEIVLESDEHKREKDYWCRAAEDAGFRSEKEVSTGKGTRLDVAISGGRISTGIEVQRSEIPGVQVKSRTTRSFRANWLPIWFSDWDRTPPWFHSVPSLGCNKQPWGEVLPPRRAATATGLRVIESVRCVIGTFQRCPEGRARPCGRYHPKPTPWIGKTIDDVAAMVPAGDAVPLQGRNGYVYLVPASSAALYEELTGLIGKFTPGGPVRPQRNSPRRPEPCHSPAHERSYVRPRHTENWRDGRHVLSGPARPCTHCGKMTILCDGSGRPSHKICVERLLGQ